MPLESDALNDLNRQRRVAWFIVLGAVLLTIGVITTGAMYVVRGEVWISTICLAILGKAGLIFGLANRHTRMR